MDMDRLFSFSKAGDDIESLNPIAQATKKTNITGNSHKHTHKIHGTGIFTLI